MLAYEGKCKHCGKKCMLSDNDVGDNHNYDGICWDCESLDCKKINADIDARSLEDRVKTIEEILKIRR